jgi:nucleoside-diphosphate-sugar epimerase
MIKRVLVTGASGFVGRHTVAPLLERGFEVHTAARKPLVNVCGVVPHELDLLDATAAMGLMQRVRPSHLLHIAWDVTPGRYWRARENLDWVGASLRLYRAFAVVGGRRVAVAGTCAEYDWSDSLLDEGSTPLRPSTLYGVAKHALHQLLAAAAAGDDIGLAWGRLFFLYGPHEASGRLVPAVIAPLLRGDEAPLSDGLVERDFMHVADAARALVALLDSDHVGAVNIASGSCRAICEVVREIAWQIGRPELVRLGALPTVPGEAPRLASTIGVLRGLGFQPRFDITSGIADTIMWWADEIRLELAEPRPA